MRPCLPPQILQAAAAAEKRRDEAIDRLLKQLAGDAPMGDPFEASMRELIDADQRVLDAIERRKHG